MRTLEGHTDGLSSACVTPDGQHVVTASWDKTARVWRLSDGSLVRTLEGHTDAVLSACVTPDGQHVVTASRVEQRACGCSWSADLAVHDPQSVRRGAGRSRDVALHAPSRNK